MALKSNFNVNDFEKIFKEKQREIENKIIRILRYVGELAVNEAKLNGNYKDHTANLRNSIGYVVAVDGKIIDEDFSLTAKGVKPDSNNPTKYGKTLAYEVAKGKNGISLVVVAGMRYAVYVEAKGRNVLTSAEQYAKSKLPILLKSLQ